MALISRSDFTEGQKPSTALWNSNFNEIYDEVNGNLDSNNLASAAVTKEKLGVMEYVLSFSYPTQLTATAEDIRQALFPYAGTLTQIDLIGGHQCSAFAIDVGLATMNSSSVGSSFFTAGSANVTASGSVLSITGASLSNTTIAADSKIVVTVKTVSLNCGKPLLINMYIDV